MNKINIIVIIMILSSAMLKAQIILSYEDFIQRVKTFHPVIKQINLIVDNAEANLLLAKANFDPIFLSNYENKHLKSINYFQSFTSDIKLNTNTPFSFSTGVTDNSGIRLNPEASMGTVSYFGINVPLIKNLMTDERRTMLKQARVFKQQSLLEQRLQINEILYHATNCYIDWMYAMRKLEIANKYLENSESRLSLMRVSFFNGDKSESDTLEVFTQMLSFKIAKREAQLNSIEKIIALSQYLWDVYEQPYLLPEIFIPQFEMELTYDSNISEPDLPQIKMYEFKLDVLSLEQKLNDQNLLPQMDMGIKSFGSQNLVPFNFNKNPLKGNFLFYVDFKYPFFARQAKAKKQIIKNKIFANLMDKQTKNWELRSKISFAEREWKILTGQMEEANRVTLNYQKLLDLELFRFEQGESSVFIINSRETKLFDNSLKLYEIEVKRIKSIANLKALRLQYY